MKNLKGFKVFEANFINWVKDNDEYKEARDFFRENNKFPHHSTVYLYEDQIVELMEKYAEFKNK